jgi:hypothetical protein
VSELQYTLVKSEDGSRNLTVFQPGGKPLACNDNHPNFTAIIEGLLKDDDSIVDLFDVTVAIGSKFDQLSERVAVTNGRVYLDGEEMDNALTQQILRFLQDGVEDWKPLVLFYENMSANPNPLAVEELYSWLGKNSITITEDGLILGYKGLSKGERQNPAAGSQYGFQSASLGKATVDGVVYQGHIPQDVGSIVEMPRGDVEFDPDRDCGVGLHVGSHDYARSYARPGLFEVHVNPRDVISVPDYGTKLRCCRYKIAKSCKAEVTKPVVPAATNKPKPSKKEKKLAKVNTGDVYSDRDPRRPRQLKVLKVLAGVARVKNVQTEKVGTIKSSRLQDKARFDRIKRGR